MFGNAASLELKRNIIFQKPGADYKCIRAYTVKEDKAASHAATLANARELTHHSAALFLPPSLSPKIPPAYSNWY